MDNDPGVSWHQVAGRNGVRGEMVSGTILLSGKHDAEEPRAPGKWFLTPFPPFPSSRYCLASLKIMLNMLHVGPHG
jgi:hypothetical protein